MQWASNQLLTTLCLKEGPKSRPGTPHPLELYVQTTSDPSRVTESHFLPHNQLLEYAERQPETVYTHFPKLLYDFTSGEE